MDGAYATIYAHNIIGFTVGAQLVNRRLAKQNVLLGS